MDNRNNWVNKVQTLKYKTTSEIFWIRKSAFGKMDIIHGMTTPNQVIISATLGQSNFVPMARQQLLSRMNQRNKFYPINKNE